MIVVRIAGPMRSGTNLLTWMLRHNFAGVATATMLLGWKHGPIVRDRTALDLDDFVDPRFRADIRAFVRDHPGEWQRVLASPLYRAAVAAQRSQSFAVALAVRDPAQWYASCVRVERESPGFLLHGVAPAEAAAFWNGSYRSWLADLGARGMIVDTDRLRQDPAPWLERMATGLGIARLPELKRPTGYLHPRGTEEVYELLGAPIVAEMERDFTRADAVDPGARDEFVRQLDRDILARLGLTAGDA